MPLSFTIEAVEPESELVIVAEVDADDRGALRCRRVTVSIEDGEITTALLREVRPARLVSVGAALARDRNQSNVLHTSPPEPAEQGQRRYRLDEQHLAEVTRIYESSAADPLPSGQTAPTQAVADHFGVSRSAAAQWVMKARRLGLLRPSRRGGSP